MVGRKTGPVLLAMIGIAASVRTGKRFAQANHSPLGNYYRDDSSTNDDQLSPPYRYISSLATDIPRVAFPVEKKTPFSFKAVPAVAVTLDRSILGKPIAAATTTSTTAVASAVPLVAPFPISLDKSFPVKFIHPVIPFHPPLLVTKLPIFYPGTFPHLDGTLPQESQNYAQPYQ